MSIKAMATVWDASPYKGVQRLIHLALADFADDEGYLWPKQETIAKKAACSERYVRETVQQMAEDGYLEIIKSGRRHKYRLLTPEPGSGKHRKTVPVNTGTQFRSYIEPSVEPSEQPSTSAPVARDEEHDMLGELPPDEPAKKPRTVPDRNTQKWVMTRFHNEAVKHGHPRYNVGALRKTVKRLRDDGYAYEEIDVLITSWFLHNEVFIRNEAKNLATLFVHQLPETEKRCADRIRAMRSGIDEDAKQREIDDHLEGLFGA